MPLQRGRAQYNLTDAAPLFGMSERALAQRIADGRGPETIKVGIYNMVPIEAVEPYKEKLREERREAEEEEAQKDAHDRYSEDRHHVLRLRAEAEQIARKYES